MVAYAHPDNAAFIVRAANSHAALVGALLDAKNRLEAFALDGHTMSDETIYSYATNGAILARAALQAAKEGQP